jgi:hypothetical protein
MLDQRGGNQLGGVESRKSPTSSPAMLLTVTRLIAASSNTRTYHGPGVADRA